MGERRASGPGAVGFLIQRELAVVQPVMNRNGHHGEVGDVGSTFAWGFVRKQVVGFAVCRVCAGQHAFAISYEQCSPLGVGAAAYGTASP